MHLVGFIIRVLSIYLLVSFQGVKAMGGRSELHDSDTHDPYSSPNIIRVIKSKDEMGSACVT